MKILLFISFNLMVMPFVDAQGVTNESKQRQAIVSLVDKYSQAREKRDTILLKSILTSDIDQLVSSGEWRNGMKESVSGMLRSSAGSPGTRTLKVEKVRFLNPQCGIADAKYEIQNADGTVRKMWSTFMVVYNNGEWKIAGIRNMLPSGPQ